MLLSIFSILLWVLVCLVLLRSVGSSWIRLSSPLLFPGISSYNIFLFSLFSTLRIINLFSLIIYTYPITTTLGFNLAAALSCWIGRIIIQFIKHKSLSSLLPVNSPWYLVPFLCLVELIRIIVRPITLCFRLLANITAGHVLISLICKMQLVWILGRIFGVLELIVAMVQGFVFSILIRVYLDESFSH